MRVGKGRRGGGREVEVRFLLIIKIIVLLKFCDFKPSGVYIL